MVTAMAEAAEADYARWWTAAARVVIKRSLQPTLKSSAHACQSILQLCDTNKVRCRIIINTINYVNNDYQTHAKTHDLCQTPRRDLPVT